MKKIAIQGIKGSFHHVSLIKYLWINEYEIIECINFNQLIQVITNKEAQLGIMAVENSTIGSLFSNYILLSNNHFKIFGTITLYIEQYLLTKIKKKFNEIISHTIALQQCDNFISEKTKLIATKYYNIADTALASLYISKNSLANKAAIASLLASKEYRLKIIYKNIQNISNNFTRFFLIEFLKKKIKKIGNNSSILFYGTKYYYNILSILNLVIKKKIIFTKIIFLNKIYNEYLFYIDIIIDNNMNYEFFKSKLKNNSPTIIIIGEYTNLFII